MTPDRVQHYIYWGATPKAIEDHYAHGRINELCASTGFYREEIMDLARRWGIDREGAITAVKPRKRITLR